MTRLLQAKFTLDRDMGIFRLTAQALRGCSDAENKGGRARVEDWRSKTFCGENKEGVDQNQKDNTIQYYRYEF